jgi:acyl-CoA synthetase (AMP-forming)/AMP-acid ligase II
MTRHPTPIPSHSDLASLVREGARQWPEHEYLKDGTRVLTYAETWRRVACIASWLRERGIGHGDRVVIVMENRIETVLMFFAVAQIGGIAVILHPQMKPEGLQRILDQTEPKLGLLEPATASLRDVFGSTPILWTASEGEALRFEDLPDDSQPAEVPFPGAGDDPAFLVFTSGSTGTPRGVILTHDNVRFVSAAIQARLQYRPEDRVAIFLPLSFDYGLYQLFYAAIAGASVFIGRPEMAGPELPRAAHKAGRGSQASAAGAGAGAASAAAAAAAAAASARNSMDSARPGPLPAPLAAAS